MRKIAENGPDAFYRGPLAELFDKEMKSGNGLITKEDLAAYRAKARKPIHGTYRGFDLYGSAAQFGRDLHCRNARISWRIST